MHIALLEDDSDPCALLELWVSSGQNTVRSFGLAVDFMNAIRDCRKKFGKIYGFVRETALYDAITVTAHEDVDYPKDRFGIAVHQLYQGANCLTWCHESTKSVKSI